MSKAKMTGLSDDDRVRLATREGNRMVGPLERERCAIHKRRWTTWRWVWDVGSSPEDADVRICWSCSECAEETES